MITQSQVTATLTQGQAIYQLGASLQQFANAIQTLLNNNWAVQVNVPGVTGLTTILSAADQATIIAQYTTLKNQLTAALAALP